MRTRDIAAGAAACVMSFFVAGSASGESVFVGSGLASNDEHVAARVAFDLSGNTLIVKLTNTASAATGANPALLENVFWTSNDLGTVGNAAFLSGVALGGGSHAVSPANAGSNFGVYGFGTGSGDPFIGAYGVGGTAWLLDFDKDHLISAAGSNPINVNSPNGPDGGLASASTTTFSPQNAIADTLIFSITISDASFNLNSIGNVRFTYGTDGTDFASFAGARAVSAAAATAAPLPATAWAGIVLLGGLGAYQLTRRNAEPQSA